MIRKEKGITLVSLIITIIIMLIIASTVGTVSLERFKINNFKKMANDIEFLQEKVSNYYLKYGALPILRSTEGNIIYEVGRKEILKEIEKDDIYYVIDLEAMDGIALNYGSKGFKAAKSGSVDTDIYIINGDTHTIYYVKGMELDGVKYHYIASGGAPDETIPPSTPQIKVISGEKKGDGKYITNIELEFIPGISKTSSVTTTYLINGGETKDITELRNNIYKIEEDGVYEITLTSTNGNGETSTITQTFIKVTPSITLDKTNIDLYVGGTTQAIIEATLTGLEGEINWTSSKNSVATVSATGNIATVNALAVGTTIITAECEGYSATCEVKYNLQDIEIGSYIKYDVTYVDLFEETNIKRTAGNGWRYLGKDGEGNNLLVSTGTPVIISADIRCAEDSQWFDRESLAIGSDDFAEMLCTMLTEKFSTIYLECSNLETDGSDYIDEVFFLEINGKNDIGEKYEVKELFISDEYASHISDIRCLTKKDIERACFNLGVKSKIYSALTGDDTYDIETLDGKAKGLFDLSPLYDGSVKSGYTLASLCSVPYPWRTDFWRVSKDGTLEWGGLMTHNFTLGYFHNRCLRIVVSLDPNVPLTIVD